MRIIANSWVSQIAPNCALLLIHGCPKLRIIRNLWVSQIAFQIAFPRGGGGTMWGLEGIASFVVGYQVQAFGFLVCGYAQAHDGVKHLQDDVGGYAAPDDGCGYAR